MTLFGSYSYDGVSAAIRVQHTEVPNLGVSWAMGNFFRISWYIMVTSRTYISLVYFGHVLGISWASLVFLGIS